MYVCVCMHLHIVHVRVYDSNLYLHNYMIVIMHAYIVAMYVYTVCIVSCMYNTVCSVCIHIDTSCITVNYSTPSECHRSITHTLSLFSQKIPECIPTQSHSSC